MSGNLHIFFLLFLRAKEKKLAKVENGWEENDKKNVWREAHGLVCLDDYWDI